MSIDKLRTHYGFSVTPFGRDIAPSQIFQARTHAEAVARLRWLIDETAIGVITGEVGAGKTIAARACVAALDASRFTTIYLPNPMVGARGIHQHLVTALGGIPKFHRPALIAQTADLLIDRPRAPQDRRPHRRRSPPAVGRTARTAEAADQHRHGLAVLAGAGPARPAHPATATQTRPLRRARPAHPVAVPPRWTPARGDRRLSQTSPDVGRPVRPALSDDAVGLIHQTSRGIPRAINNLAIQALIAAYADSKGIVDESAARAAVTEVAGE